MSTDPAPTWPIEPTTLYVVSYYADNAAATEPTTIDSTLRNYNEAVERAKELITTNANAGVCTIQIITASIVYPSIPWEDF